MVVELRPLHGCDGLGGLCLDLVQDLVVLGDLGHVDLVEFIVSTNIQYVSFVLILAHPSERILEHFLVDYSQFFGRFFDRT